MLRTVRKQAHSVAEVDAHTLSLFVRSSALSRKSREMDERHFVTMETSKLWLNPCGMYVSGSAEALNVMSYR